jgi:hypothetical protein
MSTDEAKSAESRSGYPNGYCKACCSEWKREQNFKVRYKISIEEYEQMLVFQDKKCQICEELLEPKKTVVDHCHTSGNVRGLLCYNCNNAIGFLKENIRAALKLIDYIYKNESQIQAEATRPDDSNECFFQDGEHP